MTFAHCVAVRFAIALLFMSKNEKMQNKYNGICVLTRFDLSNMDCICIACMIFAYDGAVKCAPALLLKTNTQYNFLRVDICNHL